MPVGREAEAATINQFLAELSYGPRILLIEGEAGIGKTTLLREADKTALRLGHTTVSAFPSESDAPLEFAGLADLLEQVPAAVVARLPLPQRQAVLQTLLLEERLPRSPDLPTVATAVLTVLRHLARKHPVLVVVDNLQWLDGISALALSFALRRLRLEPVGLLAAVRTDWSQNLPPLATDSVPVAQVDHLRLGPLTLAAMGELLATRTATSPGRRHLLRLYETSGGNPLFALELAARAQENVLQGLHETLYVPDSLRRLVLGRAALLPPGPRDVLLVSALSAESALPVICAAARDPATAHADLEAGIEAGFLAVTDGKIVFAHPLMRPAVAQEARAADRRAAHRRLAAVVRTAEARVRHLAMGAAGPDEAAAAGLEAAARMAAYRGARAMSADLAELAITCTPLTQAESRVGRVVLAAEQRFATADPARACALLEDIIDTARPGPGRADLWRRLARYRAFRGAPTAASIALLGRALGEAGDDDGLRAVLLIEQVMYASYAGSPAEVVGNAGLILELAGRTGDQALEARCCAGLAFSAFVSGHGLRSDLISRALAGPLQPSTLGMELRPNIAVGHLLHWTDDLDGARALYEQEYDRVIEQGVESWLPFLLWALTENEIWSGNWLRAEHLAAEGYRRAEDSGSPAALAFMSAARGLLHAYRGRTDAGVRDAARAVELAGELGMPLLTAIAAQSLGIAALSTGDAKAAHERLAPFAVAVPAEPALCRFLPDEIEALTRLGELGPAEALLTPFEARSAELSREWGNAASSRCRGLLLAAQGDLSGAEGSFDAALAIHQRLSMPFEQARTLLAAGEVHRRARRKHKALECLQAALAIFERLGAPLWESRVRDERSRVGTRVTAPEARPVLTAAERRVADLVAAGRTNAEIAADLFMGRRTVEAHLSRVYHKLGVRSRIELCRMLLSPP